MNTHGADLLTVRANKLELLERLADDLAHEIKNPLHSMVINLEVLKRRVARVGTQESDEMMRYIRILGGELERVNHRIELLLRLSRPARSSESATLHELIEELFELIQLEANHRRVALRYEPNGFAARVDAPLDTVRQVILNLVLDALDRASAGGTLVLRADREGDWARLIVRSTPGPATSPAPDSTADQRSPARGAAGSQLQQVARALSEAVGGRIELLETTDGQPEPDAGVGGSLVFSIPVARA